MTLAKNSYGNAFTPQRWAEGQIILFGQSRIVDHHHRTSPNNLPNFGRILPLVQKIWKWRLQSHFSTFTY